MTDGTEKNGRGGDRPRKPPHASRGPRDAPRGGDAPRTKPRAAGGKPGALGSKPRPQGGKPPHRFPRDDAPRAERPRPSAPHDGDKPRFARTGDKPRFAGGGEKPFFARKAKDLKPERRTAPQTPRTHERADGDERIAKVIARAGVCSRRDAEQMIADGRVEVDGKRLDSPAFNVSPDSRILIDGAPIARRERTRLWLFHKPRGYVTTESDPEGRPTIGDVLPAGLPRTVTVGRLDINTEGLLLITNDGGLARVLELPATGWLRRYRVRVHGDTDQAQLDSLRNGVTIDGIDYAGIEATYDRAQGANAWLTLGLREGKNREVKRVLEHIGLEVNRLIRVSFGPFQLGDVPEGAVEEVRTRVLKDQLGEALAAEAGVDFDTPTRDEDDRPERGERASHGERPAQGERPMRRPRTPDQGRYARSEPPVEQGPRPVRPPPRSRKHVSTLRREKDEGRPDRVKIERAETADRRGRTVTVERVVSASGVRRAEAPTRNARRFRDEADAAQGREKPAYQPRAEQGPRSPRGERDGGARKPYGSGERSGPDRARSAGDRGPPRSFDKGAPRRGEERAPSRGFDKGAAHRGGERPAGGRGPGRDRSGDAPRGAPGERWNKPAGKAASRSGDRETRGRDDRPKSAGAKRPFGDRPRAGAPRSAGAGSRPSGGAPRKGPGGPRGGGGGGKGPRPPRRGD